MSKSEEPSPEKFVPAWSTHHGAVGEWIDRRLLSPPPRPGVLAALERFEILRLLGMGGMGIVFLARDPSAARDVAIKLVKPELAGDEQIVRRFLKEAGHMAKLQHPNIVPVLETHESASGAYFVMPYFEGGNLSKWIGGERRMEREAVLQAALQVAEGLQYAHRRGIIHRDLKPANVLIGADHSACLADFGLARTVFNDSVVDVESRQCEGTAPYMSPGVAAGLAEDTRCDIYALGALLYEMLTGEPPYAGGSVREIQERIAAQPPKPILALNPDADRGLVAIAEAAMARELRDRYADVADVAADLRRAQEGGIPRGPHGLSTESGKGSGRRGVMIGVWAACACVGIALGYYTMRRAPSAPVVGSLPRPVPVAAPVLVEDPAALAVDDSGVLYLAQRGRPDILRLQPHASLAVFAGDPRRTGIEDGAGAQAHFTEVRGLAVGANGLVYASDGFTIRRISPAGEVTTLAGTARTPGNHNGHQSRLRMPSGVAADRAGHVCVADSYNIRRIDPDRKVTVVAGTDRHSGAGDGLGQNARFSDQDKALALDGAGNLWVADTLNNAVRRIAPDGKVTTVAARFNRPGGIAVTPTGDVWVADTGSDTIRRIDAKGEVTIVAGKPGERGDADGAGPDASFDHPLCLAVDRLGTAFVADAGNREIRLVHNDGRVTTLRKIAGVSP